jgi:threonine dehydratase
VSDDEIAEAIAIYWTDTHNLAEGAGAAPLAAALKEREALGGRRIGLVLSGGNIDLALFNAWVIGRRSAAETRERSLVHSGAEQDTAAA